MKNKAKKIGKIKAKKLAFSIIFALLIFTLIGTLFDKLIINISNSHHGTVFWKIDKNPVINDFVFFKMSHKLLPKNSSILSKKIVCSEGDYLIINDNFISCNDRKYPIKRDKKTGSGKSISQFYYNGIVPTNKAIVWGENPKSFDSKYWGFIGYDELKKMILIF